MGILRTLAGAFMSGWKDGNKKETEHREACTVGEYDRDFEFRLMRARSEPLKIVEYCDDTYATARVENEETAHIYMVTETSCECEDFRKNGKPCKHMIFLALQNGSFRKYELSHALQSHSGVNRDGDFVPRYWEYYSGMSMGLGYTNLYPYQVSGRVYGTSEKTGKQTNRKKTVIVNATDKTDAVAAAEDAGVMPPYASVEYIDIPPSLAQLNYLHGAGIPTPYFVSAADVSALLTRHEDEDDDRCPEYLFEMATKYRVRVSYFQSPASVKSCIWSELPEEKKAAIYCYAVYCRERGYEFGDAPIRYDAPVFEHFRPTKQEAAYIQEYQEFGWRSMHGNAKAYKSAVTFLANHGVL